MDALINIGLPIALAIIMLSLGIGLTLGDFRRVGGNLRAFLTGAVAQIIALPLVAYLFVTLFGLSGEIAVGFLLLSFCPGGVTSNMITKLARGDVALSVSLTAVISLVSIVTVPLLIVWAVGTFMTVNPPQVSVASLGIAMFVITALPVAIGVTFRHLAPGTADRVEPVLSKIATVLFVVIVLAALAGNWALFVENLTTLGPALVSMNVVLLVLGLALAGAAGLAWHQRKTIAVEVGVQNVTLGITMAALITGQSEGFSTMALPSAVYGITMYLVVLPCVMWLRQK